jgi:hypothetical protein
MFSGFQELLLIVLIVIGIVCLPRLLGRRPTPPNDAMAPPPTRFRITGFIRLALFGSMAWILATAVYLEPWTRWDQHYLIVGVGPVLLFWGLIWIISGYRKYRK